MKPIHISCCSALINPFYLMVEGSENKYTLSIRFLRLLTYLMAGTVIAQTLGCLSAYLLVEDSQAAGMISHLLIQHLSYYLLGCAFLILSFSNILIRRGMTQLKMIRMPSLIMILCVAAANFLLIPRMDYLRESALQDGLPVMLSPFANYFAILNGITVLLLCVQIISSVMIAWRLTDNPSPKIRTNLRN